MENSTLQYREIKDAGVVIAKLENTTYDACYIADKVLEDAGLKYIEVITQYGNETMEKKYSAKAKCNSGCDDYDYEVGAKLAQKRCLDKYHKALSRNFMHILQDLRTAVATFEYYLERRGISYDNVETIEDIKKSRFYNNL